MLLGLLGLSVVAAEQAGVGLVLKADKGTYAQGEPIILTLQVVNRNPQPVSLQFRTSQRYDLVVQDAQGQPVWRWSAGRMFLQVIGEEALQPGPGQLTYRITVGEPFPPGRYSVIGIIPAEEGPISATLNIRIE